MCGEIQYLQIVLQKKANTMQIKYKKNAKKMQNKNEKNAHKMNVFPAANEEIRCQRAFSLHVLSPRTRAFSPTVLVADAASEEQHPKGENKTEKEEAKDEIHRLTTRSNTYDQEPKCLARPKLGRQRRTKKRGSHRGKRTDKHPRHYL